MPWQYTISYLNHKNRLAPGTYRHMHQNRGRLEAPTYCLFTLVVGSSKYVQPIIALGSGESHSFPCTKSRTQTSRVQTVQSPDRPESRPSRVQTVQSPETASISLIITNMASYPRNQQVQGWTHWPHPIAERKLPRLEFEFPLPRLQRKDARSGARYTKPSP